MIGTTLRAGLAATLMLALASPALADTRPPKVRPKDLPTTARVADLYPALDGGSRYLSRRAKAVLMRDSEDCVQTQMIARADRGTRADFFTADDQDPFSQGLDDPTVAGYRFPTVADAETVLADVAAYADRCAGEHSGSEDHTVTLTRLDDPALEDLGDEAIALDVVIAWPDGGYHELAVVVRDARSVSLSVVRQRDAAPDLDAGLALARVAWHKLR